MATSRSPFASSTPSRARALPALTLALALALGCASTERSPAEELDPAARPEDAASRPSAPPPASSAITLRRVRFEEGAMTLEVVDAPHSTHAWDVGGVLSQQIRISDEDVLYILVRAGEGETLASLRRDHPGAHATELAPGRVCDVVARRVELHEPEEFIECIEYADGSPSSPGYTPAMTIVAQEFRSRGLDVVARWELPTALRDRYRAEEARFFSSFACGPTAPAPASDTQGANE